MRSFFIAFFFSFWMTTLVGGYLLWKQPQRALLERVLDPAVPSHAEVRSEKAEKHYLARYREENLARQKRIHRQTASSDSKIKKPARRAHSHSKRSRRSS